MNGLKNPNSGGLGRHLPVPRERQPPHCLVESPGSVEQASLQDRAHPPAGEWGLLPVEAPAANSAPVLGACGVLRLR